MDLAVRYNHYLRDQVLDWAKDKTRLLDFGAGNGRFAISLQKRGFEIHAIEIDPDLRSMIDLGGVIAHANLSDVSGEIFDGIYTLNVLEHIENDEAILRQFHERLAPMGGLLIYVPAFTVLFSANDVRVGHVRRYRRTSLVAKLERAGFMVDQARYADCIGFFATLAYRIFGDPDGGLNPTMIRFYDRVLFPMSRAFDRIFEHFFGKNLLVLAHKPKSEQILKNRGPKSARPVA
ncbi:MAG: class I SAM-dependent methyltransferase [Myxococcales bacterium]|nr:class I SAM-dependent methyltransferase [Myxococcales bacterium]HIK85607.1 class I SAM-dependent methyltransferase [Myxococcales bacterium]